MALSPSECLHWSISISHGAFSANPAGRLIRQLGKEVHTSGKPVNRNNMTAAGLTPESDYVKLYTPIIPYYTFPKRSQMSISLFTSGWCSLEAFNPHWLLLCPASLATHECLLAFLLALTNTHTQRNFGLKPHFPPSPRPPFESCFSLHARPVALPAHTFLTARSSESFQFF